MNAASDLTGPEWSPEGLTPERKPRLYRVLESYQLNVEAGRAVSPAELIAAHPDIAADLRACLPVVNLADELAMKLREESPPPDEGPDGRSTRGDRCDAAPPPAIPS